MAMAASSRTADSASNSTSADLNINANYDVFINHRGPDVKKTLASHLYRALRSHGLKVFLDQPELQPGDSLKSQIEGAIRTASVHVAIFSKTYAKSTWCLNELSSMLESKAPIIPVFYKVKPAVLRWMRTRGKKTLYAKALLKLEKKTTYDSQAQEEKPRYSSTVIENWRKALSSVANISGFELEACNGDEGALVDKVVESVLRKVRKTPLNVAEYPTGLAEKVTDFENKVLLQHQQQSGRKPRVVGIVGLGGVGKSTLAKELFNRKSSHYSKTCFLSDIREKASKGSLILLQRELLNCFGSDRHINNTDENIEELKRLFPSSPILLILDDVDRVDQVDYLVPNQSFIHSNSLIVITSRIVGVLTNWGVEKSSIYKLNGLNEQHSRELFCWHAFSQPYPFPEFDSLTTQFLRSCDGLPLSLKVLGALLRGNNDQRYWFEQLARLEKILPDDIQERLLISYEALNTQEKNIFLDIACFFIGENVETAITIWNASGWNGWLGFQSLQNRSMVELNGMNEIHIHDHLRDLGRDVAKKLSPRRLWRWTEEVIDDLLGQSSPIIVRGIRMVTRGSEVMMFDGPASVRRGPIGAEDALFDDDAFSDIGMRRLQLLDTQGALLNSILRRVKYSNLIWIRWKDCPYSSLPPWIPMKNLRVLHLSDAISLETLCQLPECLEELRIECCPKLTSVWGSGQATKLRVLDISWCSKLEELPNMETWVSLEELRADGCENLKSIRGLSQLSKLWKLTVGGCSELEWLEGAEHCTWLEMLNVSGCPKLQCPVWE